MKRPVVLGLLLAGALAAPGLLRAADSVEFLDGTVREGKIVGVDERTFRLRIPAPMPGQPPAVIAINRADVDKIVFGREPELDALIDDSSLARLAAARVMWQRMEPFLTIPESHAASAGIAYGDILLKSTDARRHQEAFDLFQRLEKEAWNPLDRESATRGRLRAMLELGMIDEASQEAQALADEAEDPELLLNIKLLLAQTRLAALQELLEENPRWNEDPPVRAARNQLLNDALDLALYPFLFHGTAHDEAAQGLWLARDIYLLAGDDEAARAVAKDLIAIYPRTRYAEQAREALPNPEPEES